MTQTGYGKKKLGSDKKQVIARVNLHIWRGGYCEEDREDDHVTCLTCRREKIRRGRRGG
jgi:hypothetical protein